MDAPRGESRLPHRFADPALLELALTHSSTGEVEDNERLEFLGDAALDLIAAEELYLHHTERAEGVLTELKAWMVSRRTLADAARALGLDSMALVGRGLEDRALSRAVLANLYEAVLGAVYLDGGLEATRHFVSVTLAEALERVREEQHDVHPKGVLQELAQREHGVPPEYKLVESRGRAHARAFLVRACIRDESFPGAWGRTRKEAEHWAAYEALLVIEEREES